MNTNSKILIYSKNAKMCRNGQLNYEAECPEKMSILPCGLHSQVQLVPELTGPRALLTLLKN